MTSAAQKSDDRKAIEANLHQATVYFEHQGREIVVVFSLYSGQERIYVDGGLVSQSRNWHFSNTHRFSIGGVDYTVEIEMAKRLKNLLAGLLDIRLLADGEVIDSDQFRGTRYVLQGNQAGRSMTWRSLLWLLPFFGVGAAVGFAVAYAVIGSWS